MKRKRSTGGKWIGGEGELMEDEKTGSRIDLADEPRERVSARGSALWRSGDEGGPGKHTNIDGEDADSNNNGNNNTNNNDFRK